MPVLEFPPEWSRQCRGCGCREYTACYDPKTGRGCYWAEEDLCSVCAAELRSARQ